MNKVTYMIRRIAGMNYKQFFENVGKAHAESGKSRPAIFFDMVFCGFRYGCGHADYCLFEFWTLTGAQRRTYLTRGKNNLIVRNCNRAEDRDLFENKVTFNQTFEKFLGRKWLDLRDATAEDLGRFLEGLDAVIAKPLAKSGGFGIEKLRRADFESDEAMWQHLRDRQLDLLEECVIQHPDLAAFNPYAVNTYRICTLLADGVPHVMYAFVRIGSGKRVVDNLHSGGISCPIDLETGILTHPGYAVYLEERRVYDTHPDSGKTFVGAQMPGFDQALELVKEAALVHPAIAYVGWDVAATEHGPVLIEGNPFPGHDILQLPPHTPDHIGILPKFRQYLPFL